MYEWRYDEINTVILYTVCRTNKLVENALEYFCSPLRWNTPPLVKEWNRKIGPPKNYNIFYTSDMF